MANRYWVGGSGTWDASSTTNWSATSGGSAGASAPTSSDAVIIDSASGSGTITTASGSVCAALTLDSATLGLTFGANHTCSSSFLLTQGSVNLQSYVLSCTVFSSSTTNTRSITFGTGKIQLTGNAATLITLTTGTGLTVTGTKLFEATYSGSTGTRTFAMGSAGSGATEANAVNVSVTAGTDIVSITTNRILGSLDTTGFAGTLTLNSATYYGDFIISSGLTFGTVGSVILAATSGTKTITTNGKTIDAPLTFNGVGGSWQLQDNLTIGSTRTVTLTNGALDLNNNTLSCGLFSSSNSNTRSIAFGTGNITLTGSGATIWTTATATNFSVTGTPVVNCTYAGSTGTRTISMGSVIESRTISVNVSAGSDAVSFTTSNGSYKNLNLTGFSGSATLGSTTNIYGSLTIPAGITFSSVTASLAFRATSGTQTITTNGVTFDFPITFNGVGGTWEFADALTQGSTRAFTIQNGTVKLKSGATSTVGAFATSGSTQKYLQSTTAGSQATLSQASGTVTVSYLSIKDIAATGGATWNAYVDYNNVDQGDNTGWDFSYSPAIDNEFSVALRSFTQPKRF